MGDGLLWVAYDTKIRALNNIIKLFESKYGPWKNKPTCAQNAIRKLAKAKVQKSDSECGLMKFAVGYLVPNWTVDSTIEKKLAEKLITLKALVSTLEKGKAEMRCKLHKKFIVSLEDLRPTYRSPQFR